MKILVTLSNTGGEIAREEIEVTDRRDPNEATNLAIHEIVSMWILSPGDSIAIGEVAA